MRKSGQCISTRGYLGAMEVINSIYSSYWTRQDGKVTHASYSFRGQTVQNLLCLHMKETQQTLGCNVSFFSKGQKQKIKYTLFTAVHTSVSDSYDDQWGFGLF